MKGRLKIFKPALRQPVPYMLELRGLAALVKIVFRNSGIYNLKVNITKMI